METVLAPVVICSLLLSPGAIPSPSMDTPHARTATILAPMVPGPIASAIRRDVPRLAMPSPLAGARQPAQKPAETRSWISRHPALFGALVGAAAGAVFGATADNELICKGGDEDCLIYGNQRIAAGAGIGAGIGALVGLVVGIAR